MQYPPRPSQRPVSVGHFFLLFGYTWLTLGFFAGTVTLVLLIRPILAMLDRFGVGEIAKNRALIGVIFLFAAGSFVLARFIVRRLLRVRSLQIRRTSFGLLALPALLCVWAWSSPGKLLADVAGSATHIVRLRGGPRFIFGAYPDDAQLAALKRQGITAIVSLQHPRIPVEIGGIADERRTVSELGMTLIQLPMLPWVSDNRESIDKLRELARTGHGTYYVHCGLGRDRVNIARRVISSLPQARVQTANVEEAVGFEARREPFERGFVYRLAPETWLVPFPNVDEFYGHIVQGRPGHLLLVLDSTDTRQRRWLHYARNQADLYAIPFTVVQFAERDGEARGPDLVRTVRSQPGLTTIVVPTTGFGGERSAAADVLLQAYGISASSPWSRHGA